MPQRVSKQMWILSAVKAEFHLCEIRLQMFCAQLVPCTDNAALEQRERRFRRVRVNVTVNVNLVFVFDCFVLATVDASVNHGLRISAPLVSHNHINIGTDVFFDVLRERARRNIGCMEESQIAASLTDSDYDLFVFPGPLITSLPPANVGLVHFNRPREHRTLCLGHSLADAMAQVPRGLVAPADHALDLVGRHSFAGFTDEIRHKEPFRQRQMGVVKDRSRRDRELVAALIAIVLVSLYDLRNGSTFAARTHRAFGPTQRLKVFAALVLTAELLHYIQKAWAKHGIS